MVRIGNKTDAARMTIATTIYPNVG